jgi:D-alanyl-D-alanine carboxypeptidase/D-alanyl-D-alanine-endopeptidase (penicillin-binding protein 4)
MLISSYSIPLKELVRITKHVSHNLYAEALLKTIGLKYRKDETISSFEKGVRIVKDYWADKGLNTSSLWMYDGSGLATTDKLTASFICELLSYMYTKSSYSKSFIESLPRAGMDGTVANILKGSVLQENTRLKSGSMSRVRSYAGYHSKEDKVYAIAIIVNNFSCTQTQIKKDIEQLLLSLLP